MAHRLFQAPKIVFHCHQTSKDSIQFPSSDGFRHSLDFFNSPQNRQIDIFFYSFVYLIKTTVHCTCIWKSYL